MKTAKELGFIPEYKPMNEEQSRLFISIMLASQVDKAVLPEDDLPFVIQIVQKRIEAMKLPIDFDTTGLLAALILSDGNPGKMVTILIDSLTKYEGQTVTIEEISEVYPWGFYTDESFEEYVEKYLKTRKCKWGHIY